MKILILTLPLHTNYGGILQAFALQRSIEQLGHEVKLINMKHPIPRWKRVLITIKRILLRVTGKDRRSIFYDQEILKAVSGQINKFVTNVLRFLPGEVVSNRDFKRIQNYSPDCIVVGSDQVWRPKYVKNIENMFLDFAGNWGVRRISYAASFGVDTWEYSASQTKKCKALIQKFDHVSVRESSGIDLCEQYFDLTPELVIDPTLLLSQNEYLGLIESQQGNDGGLFSYMLDPTPAKQKFVESQSRALGLPIHHIYPSYIFDKHPSEYSALPSIEEWLANFSKASFIVTDSFHGCVFSILFNKPFYVTTNIARGSTRISNLLALLNLESCLLNEDKLEGIEVTPYIQWDEVNIAIERLRKDSLRFLKVALSGLKP